MKLHKIEDVKEFMELLFLKESFDKFCMAGMELKTIVTFSADGKLAADWLEEEDRERYASFDYVPWKLFRPIAFSLIRGKQTPRFMRIQFVYYMENGDHGGLRIQYENGELTCMSSFTTAQFSMDKSSEQMWDENCITFLKKNKIVSTQLS